MNTTIYDIAIVGSGPAGLSAAARATAVGASHILLEADPRHAADTIYHYQKGKHVMAEPGIVPLRSDMSFTAGRREKLLETWDAEIDKFGINIQYGQRVNAILRGPEDGVFTLRCDNGAECRSRTVILAIGLQGNIRKIGVPGEQLKNVQYTLSDPAQYSNETIIVIGAGDAGIENALALADRNTVYLIHRGEEMVSCKEANRDLILAAHKLGKVKICYGATSARIEEGTESKPLSYVFNDKDGETAIACDRVIARLGATPPRKLIESFGVIFPNANPTAVPVLSESYESNVPGLYIVGALGGYPLIKQAMNQGYEVVQSIINKPVEPVDAPLLREKFKTWKPSVPVPEVVDLIMHVAPLFHGVPKLQLRDFLLESTFLRMKPGEIVFKKFDYTNTFFTILEGSVNVEITESNDEKKMVTLGVGRYFGEMGIISGRRRAATIIAGNPCVLLESPRRSILKLMSSVDEVRQKIDEIFIRHALSNYIGPALTQEAIDELIVSKIEMRRYKANEILFKDGDAADGLYLIRRGSVIVSKVENGKERILSYISAGNYIGEMALVDDAPRSATVTATVMTEVLVLPGDQVRKHLAVYPGLRQSFDNKILERLQNNVMLEHSQDSESELIRFLLNQGIGEATDVLLIDQSLCIQCNNCETACAQTHGGTSRLEREAGPSFASIHLPTACRHCENPLCMKDCPPDAIGRSELGEVFISDACIGCGNCERNCPYGVIHMAEQTPPEKSGGLLWTLFGLGKAPGERQTSHNADAQKKAVKCDLCKDLPGGSACARSCPTGAAIRVSPEHYLKSSKIR